MASRYQVKKKTNLYACFWTQLERTNSKEYSFVKVLVVKTKLFAKFLLLGTFIQYWPFQTRSRVRENYTQRKKSFKGILRNISVTLFALLNENCCRSTLFIEFLFMSNLPLKSFDQYHLVKSLRKQPPLNALPLRISSKHLLVSAQFYDVNE